MDLSGSYNGLVFGPATSYPLAGPLTGLEDMPAVRSNDAPRTGDHGAYRGVDLLDERSVILQFELLAATLPAYDALVAAVAAAFVPQAVDLALLFNGSTRLINCRPRRRALTRDPARAGISGLASVELIAADPRIYDAALQSPTTGLANITSGATFNATFNLGFGAIGGGGYIQATNAGSFPTRPVATILGPATNPRLENITAAKFVKFNITLSATDTLTVDFDAHTVLLNGTASRRSTMTSDSQWWELASGINSIRFSSDTYDPAALLTLAFRSAWL